MSLSNSKTYFDALPMDLQNELSLFFTDNELFRLYEPGFEIVEKICKFFIKACVARAVNKSFPLDILLLAPLGYVIKYVIPQLNYSELNLSALYPKEYPYLTLIQYLIIKNIRDEIAMKNIDKYLPEILMEAIERNACADDVRFLLDVSPNKQLITVIRNNRLDLLDHIFERTNSEWVYREALSYAASNSNLLVMDCLLAKLPTISIPQDVKDYYLSWAHSREAVQKMIDCGFHSEKAVWQLIALKLNQSAYHDEFLEILDAFPNYITKEQYMRILEITIERNYLKFIICYLPILQKHINLDLSKLKNRDDLRHSTNIDVFEYFDNF